MSKKIIAGVILVGAGLTAIYFILTGKTDIVKTPTLTERDPTAPVLEYPTTGTKIAFRGKDGSPVIGIMFENGMGYDVKFLVPLENHPPRMDIQLKEKGFSRSAGAGRVNGYIQYLADYA